MVAIIIFAYMLIVQLALPVVLFVVHGLPEGGVSALDFKQAMTYEHPLALAMYAGAAATSALAFVIPPRIAGRNVLVAFVIRLSLWETISVLGFALAFVDKQPMRILPFLIVGLAGTLASPPPVVPGKVS